MPQTNPTTYRPALLDPHPHPAAAAHNAACLGPRTLGIEVTEPALAARCGLGNIDPQHRPDGGAVAAIEAALHWPLPPPGACLVTIRPDADAYGAMAVLGLRAEGVTLSDAARARLHVIARADRFDRGAWPGPRPLPRSPAEIDEVGPGEQDLGALIAGLAQPDLPPDAAVGAARAWLLRGAASPVWRTRAAAAADRLFAALAAGEVRVSAPHPGRIAVVEGAMPGALRLGYRLAPVVVGVDTCPRGTPPEPWRRVTVAQWCPGHADLPALAARLNALEPGWGGSPTIVGSPQGRPSRLELAAALRAFLDNCSFPRSRNDAGCTPPGFVSSSLREDDDTATHGETPL